MSLSRAQASMRRINEVFDEQPDIADGPSDKTVQDGSVEFDDVCFSYTRDPEKLNLRHVSFRIESGETVGVIGGTGEGKSTLVSLIPRFYDTLSGTVRVGGTDVRAYILENLRAGVSMVLQNGTLFSGTIASNLRWGKPDATLEEMKAACAIACADEYIDRFPDGYETLLDLRMRPTSPAASGSACALRARSSKIRRSSFSTTRPARSIWRRTSISAAASAAPCPARRRSSSPSASRQFCKLRPYPCAGRRQALRLRHARRADGAQPDLPRRIRQPDETGGARRCRELN